MGGGGRNQPTLSLKMPHIMVLMMVLTMVLTLILTKPKSESGSMFRISIIWQALQTFEPFKTMLILFLFRCLHRYLRPVARSPNWEDKPGWKRRRRAVGWIMRKSIEGCAWNGTIRRAARVLHNTAPEWVKACTECEMVRLDILGLGHWDREQNCAIYPYEHQSYLPQSYIQSIPKSKTNNIHSPIHQLSSSYSFCQIREIPLKMTKILKCTKFLIPMSFSAAVISSFLAYPRIYEP